MLGLHSPLGLPGRAEAGADSASQGQGVGAWLWLHFKPSWVFIFREKIVTCEPSCMRSMVPSLRPIYLQGSMKTGWGERERVFQILTRPSNSGNGLCCVSWARSLALHLDLGMGAGAWALGPSPTASPDVLVGSWARTVRTQTGTLTGDAGTAAVVPPLAPQCQTPALISHDPQAL